MSSHSPHHSARYWSRILGLLACIVAIGAAGGLSLVWLRQQITDTAARIQVTQRERVRVERRLEYLRARIAEAHRSDVLRAKALAMGLTLTQPESQQIVRMGPLRPADDPSSGPVMPVIRAGDGSPLGGELASMESFSRYGD